jgi:hypothetical protein
MRKLVLVVATGALLALPAASASPEYCQATNPVQPKCTFKATHSGETPVTGVAGEGKWVVKVKRGRQVIKLKSPASGEPTAIEFNYKKGDKVIAVALSAGSYVVAGHAD